MNKNEKIIHGCDVVVIGSVNIDQTVVLDLLPNVGETLTGKELIVTEGGKGANQAVACARLKIDTAFIGCIGDDSNGRAIRKRLKSEKISCDFLLTKPGVPTGLAFIFLDSNGENMISVVAGANNAISCEDIDRGSKLIGNSKLLLLQHEIPQKVVEYSAQIACKSGIRVILNPAPARKISEALLKRVHCVVPNETEAESITSISSNCDDALFMQSEWFHERGVNVVIITLGEKGVHLSENGECSVIPACKVSVVDTVAAGDCFCGALAAAIVKEKDWFSAAEFAVKASSIAVMRKGAMISMPYLSDIQE